MSRRSPRLFWSAVRASVLTGLTLAACTGDPGGDPEPTPLTVTPATAQVATCRVQQFSADTLDPVTWSVIGAGTIDATGAYRAPIQVPANPAVQVVATTADASGSATIGLATAFPGTLRDLAPGITATRPDAQRTVAARGTRAYAIVQTGAAPFQVSVIRSDDGGATWGAAVLVASHGGPARLEGTSLAIDAGDPEVVHVVLRADAGGWPITTIGGLGTEAAGSLAVLATSTDGGHTFTQRTLYTGGNGDVPGRPAWCW